MVKPRKKGKKKKEREFILPHKRWELLNPQEMTSHEIRASLEAIKASKEKGVTRKTLSEAERIFVFKVARQIAKTDRARAENILKSFDLPPLRDRKRSPERKSKGPEK